MTVLAVVLIKSKIGKNKTTLASLRKLNLKKRYNLTFIEDTNLERKGQLHVVRSVVAVAPVTKSFFIKIALSKLSKTYQVVHKHTTTQLIQVLSLVWANQLCFKKYSLTNCFKLAPPLGGFTKWNFNAHPISTSQFIESMLR